MNKFEQVMEKVKGIAEALNDEGPIKKRIPMKAEWTKMHKELKAASAESDRMKAKYRAISDEFWAKIRRELDYPANDLSIIEDGKTLVIRGDAE